VEATMTDGPGADLPAVARLAELSARLGRCPDLDAVLTVALSGLAELCGFGYSLLLLLDETGAQLYTIASHGYETAGIGSEVVVGEGVIGMSAARAAPMRVGNLRHMLKYARAVRRGYEEQGAPAPGREIPLPGLPDAASQLAVPAMVLGRLVGVLAVESPRNAAFDETDEALLTVVAGMVGSAIELDAARETADADTVVPRATATAAEEVGAASRRRITLVRFFPVDGSTFLDGEYLIKGVAGRILWSLLAHHEREGREEFTNREVRLDPTLELPELRDNLESRLILLKRRLDERDAPGKLEKTGRGRFRLVVDTTLRLESVGTEREAGT
jgi:adenylate cyclase